MTHKKFELGESVVNRNTLKQGKVVDSDDDEKGLTENVKVEYKDGSAEWLMSGNVTKMLVETDPPVNKTFLTE